MRGVSQLKTSKLILQLEASRHLDFWCKSNKKIALKIKQMLKTIVISPRTNLWDAKRLKHCYVETRSLRINRKDRLVYEIYQEDVVVVLRIRGHYDDK